MAMCICAMPYCLAQSWPEIKTEMRPGTRWWWLGSAVDPVNIGWCIDQYAKTGIGAVEITPIYGVVGNEANDIPYLTPEWMQQLKNVQQAADRHGMYVDMNQGTGWPFGGPEVSIEDAACKAIFLVDTVQIGGSPISTIPEKDKSYNKFLAENRRALTDSTEEVIRLYEGRTRQAVKRAAPGGEGLVIDHYDRGAVSRYLDKYDRAFRDADCTYPHSFFNDSYEVYGANWTPTLLDEFERRRGYRLQDHLAELLGHVDDGNQALSDYRETVSELLLENFTEQWAARAHEHGVKVRNQAHGSPANLIDLYAAVDIPEIEGFGLSDFGIKGLRTDSGYTRKNYSDVSMLKYASSAAHITGKPLTSCETFTWLTEHFRTSLSQMKPDLDLIFTCGINNVYFHGTAYSPKDDPWPGWKFYASVDMSPTNTIWRDAPALMQYITRCQSMLQEGRPDNDFLVYLPIRDLWHQRLKPGEKGLHMAFDIHAMDKQAPEFIRAIMQIDSLGYDCDYISDKYLLTTKMEHGSLTTAAGTKYRGLIIPGSGNLTPEVKEHIEKLRSEGANIIYGIDTDAISRVCEPEAMRTLLGLRAVRRADSDGHHYFIANLTPNDIDASVLVSVEYTDAVWFDPLNGDIYRARTDGEGIHVALRSGESRILRLYDHEVAVEKTDNSPIFISEIDLSGNRWELSIAESIPETAGTWQLDSLQYWTDLGDKDLDILMGTGVYTTEFELTADDLRDAQWSIDLGDVRESAKVYVNDTYVGTAWAVPFALDISAALKAGENKLRIEVTNLPANYIADMDRRGIKWRKFKEINVVDINYKKTTYDTWETVPSGISEVKLLKFGI